MALTDKIPPEWNAPGIEPPDSKKDTGFEADDLVPAGWLNWFMTGVSAFLQDAQENGASTAWVQEQINKIAIPLIDSNTSTSKTSAPTADALRRTVESMAEALALKQNTVRLADNYKKAASLPPEYPDGITFFKITGGVVNGWPCDFGNVTTERTGSSATQMVKEVVTSSDTADKSGRVFVRNKRDANGGWQPFVRLTTEVDLDAVKKSVSDGKILVRDSITTAKGIVADADGDGIPTHAELATGVGTILTRATADAVLDPAMLVQGYSGYDDGIKKNGTMPQRTGIVNATGTAQWGDGQLAAYLPGGYYPVPGSEIRVSVAQLQAAEGDLTPNNIRNGTTIYGITGNLVPGFLLAAGEVSLSGTPFDRQSQRSYFQTISYFTSNIPGVLRIKYNPVSPQSGGEVQIHKNEVPAGPLRVFGPNQTISYVEDIAVKPGDTIQIKSRVYADNMEVIAVRRIGYYSTALAYSYN